jgi:hypothetical protein
VGSYLDDDDDDDDDNDNDNGSLAFSVTRLYCQ